MPNPQADILRAAKARIDKPEKWCQGRARLEDRECASQALCAAAMGLGGVYSMSYNILIAAAREISPHPSPATSPVTVNDRTDHPTVMKMYDRAIELAEA